MNLTNKRMVITGANGALGRVVVASARELGATVVQLDLRFADDAAADCHAVDLCDLDATRAAFHAIGPFDAVCNLAGGFAMGANAWDDSDDQWDLMFKLNVRTLRNVLKAAVPLLLDRGRGSIVNVGAYGALRGQAAMSAYCAAKSVVMRLTESLGDELRDQGINVNAVLPTVIDTAANRDGMPNADPGKWVAPADLAQVICFLVSDAARAVHGALLPVRGLS